MNKKFNLLALAAAASACGALVLTSCGGSGKTHIVLFKTDGLRNILDANKPTLVSLKAQHVKDGKLAKSPIDITEATKKYARFTYYYDKTAKKLDDKKHVLLGWSESTEDETDGSKEYRAFDFSRPITGDTVLYPIYSTNKVHCLTIELKQSATHTADWNEIACNREHVWAENWFETGSVIESFETKLKSVIDPAPNMEIDKWQVADKSTGELKDFTWANATIDEDLTLIAHYNTK